MIINIENIMTFKELAKQAEQNGNEDVINFARKVILNGGGDPNKYFTEQRTTLTGDNVVTKLDLTNG